MEIMIPDVQILEPIGLDPRLADVIANLERSGARKCWKSIDSSEQEKLLVERIDTPLVTNINGTLEFGASIVNLETNEWRNVEINSICEKRKGNELLRRSINPKGGYSGTGRWEIIGHNLQEIDGRFVDGIYLHDHAPTGIRALNIEDPIKPKEDGDIITHDIECQGYVELDKEAWELVKGHFANKNYGLAGDVLLENGFVSVEIQESDEMLNSLEVVIQCGGYGQGEQKQNYVKITKLKPKEELFKELVEWKYQTDEFIQKLPQIVRYERYYDPQLQNPEVRTIDNALELRDMFDGIEGPGAYKTNEERERSFTYFSKETSEDILLYRKQGTIRFSQEALEICKPHIARKDYGLFSEYLLENFTVKASQEFDFTLVEIS